MVLYNPDETLARQASEQLMKQVDRLCLVDNSEVSHAAWFDASKCHYISLGKNRGIAYAQNRGIEQLMASGMDFVLFADQDTTVPDGIVPQLVEEYLELEKQQPVIAIGPEHINRQTGKAYRTETPLTYVMSSFSLSRLDYFRKVGLMNEQLFIDAVECEWQWRAQHLIPGATVSQISKLKVEHELGHYRRILGKDCNISSPQRLYYQLRNFLWLRRVPYVPKLWKRRNMRRYMLKILAYPLLVSPRMAYLSSIKRAISHGLKQHLAT